MFRPQVIAFKFQSTVQSDDVPLSASLPPPLGTLGEHDTLLALALYPPLRRCRGFGGCGGSGKQQWLVRTSGVTTRFRRAMTKRDH